MSASVQIVIAAFIWLVILIVVGTFTVMAAHRFGRWAGQCIHAWRWPTPCTTEAHEACGLDDDDAKEFTAILTNATKGEGIGHVIRNLDRDITRRFGEQYQQPPRVEDQWGAR